MVITVCFASTRQLNACKSSTRLHVTLVNLTTCQRTASKINMYSNLPWQNATTKLFFLLVKQMHDKICWYFKNTTISTFILINQKVGGKLHRHPFVSDNNLHISNMSSINCIYFRNINHSHKKDSILKRLWIKWKHR